MSGWLEEGGMSGDEVRDAGNFLALEGYIHLRDVASKNEANLSDCHYDTLEARLTGKGIRLLAGGIEDTMIEV